MRGFVAGVICTLIVGAAWHLWGFAAVPWLIIAALVALIIGIIIASTPAGFV